MRMVRLTNRLQRPVGALLLGVAGALLPTAALACGPTDLGACVDGAVYDAWMGAAAVLWLLDRTLLALAYQIDTLRSWLVQIAFAGVYQVLTDAVGPLLAPIATVAAFIGGLGFLLVPLLGRTNLVNLRQVLVWALLAPALLTLSGPLLVDLDHARVSFGAALFDAGGDIGTVPLLGAAANDMAAPAPLYPANPCGTGTFSRSTGGIRADDLAAALLYADTRDIHCPPSGNITAVPMRFYEEAPTGPQYAVTWKVGDERDPVRRSNAITGVQQGVARLLLGLLPCLLAIVDAFLQLLFALALMVLWVGLPLCLLFVFFQHTSGGLGMLFRRAVSIFQTSWSCSFLTGMFFLCLTSTAQLGNAAAYAGFAIGALIVEIYLLTVAAQTLRDSLRTLNDIVQTHTGLTATGPLEVAGQLATATALTALTGAAGLAATGSATYALGAMAGRLRPVSQLGAVAAAMGVDTTLTQATDAGALAGRSIRAMGQRMQRDGRRRDPSPAAARGDRAPSPATGAPAPAQRPDAPALPSSPAVSPTGDTATRSPGQLRAAITRRSRQLARLEQEAQAVARRTEEDAEVLESLGQPQNAARARQDGAERLAAIARTRATLEERQQADQAALAEGGRARSQGPTDEAGDGRRPAADRRLPATSDGRANDPRTGADDTAGGPR